MNLARALGHEVGSPPMSDGTAIVFVVDDDVSVRESLELLIRCKGCSRRYSRPHRNFSAAHEFLFRAASYLTFLFQVSMVLICRNASPAIGSTCRSSSLRVTVTYQCPSRP